MFGKEFETLPYGQWKILQEIKIRGRFISLSTNLEYYIIKIILYSDTKNPETTRKFKVLPLSKKLSWMKEDLEKHFPKEFNSLAYTFDLLENKLLTIRNHMAHCEMFFDENENDRSFIEIRDIMFIDGENKFEKIRYTLNELQEAIDEFIKINAELLKIWGTLVEDYILNHPDSSNTVSL